MAAACRGGMSPPSAVAQRAGVGCAVAPHVPAPCPLCTGRWSDTPGPRALPHGRVERVTLRVEQHALPLRCSPAWSMVGGLVAAVRAWPCRCSTVWDRRARRALRQAGAACPRRAARAPSLPRPPARVSPSARVVGTVPTVARRNTRMPIGTGAGGLDERGCGGDSRMPTCTGVGGGHRPSQHPPARWLFQGCRPCVYPRASHGRWCPGAGGQGRPEAKGAAGPNKGVQLTPGSGSLCGTRGVVQLPGAADAWR